jgi:1,4-alpha-glucan branching enzyme
LQEVKAMATKAKATGKASKKAAPKGGAAKRKRKPLSSTVFSLHAPDVTEVYLSGDFNGWQPDAKEYRLRKFKGDVWKKSLKLKPGRYEYQFVVDGQWWCDPANDNRVTNPYCTENSVIEVI